MKTNTKKGFTLVELLVVIAIIGVLSSVVLASLNTARQKGRDAGRIGDVNQIRIALELYFDDNGGYPNELTDLSGGGYIPVVPSDPLGAAYSYSGLGSGASCTSYHLGTTLEGAANSVLDTDRDAAAGTACTGSAADFAGTDPIYDLKP